MYSLWGGGYHHHIHGVEHDSDQTVRTHFREVSKTFVFISITGPSILSWSIFIKCPISKSTLEEKLLEFKSNIELRRNSIGLLTGPGLLYNEDKPSTRKRDTVDVAIIFIRIAKKIFPNTSFLTANGFNWYEYYGVDSTSDGKKKGIYLFIISLLLYVNYFQVIFFVSDSHQKLIQKLTVPFMILTYN